VQQKARRCKCAELNDAVLLDDCAPLDRLPMMHPRRHISNLGYHYLVFLSIKVIFVIVFVY
jgi:hypothetical protein